MIVEKPSIGLYLAEHVDNQGQTLSSLDKNAILKNASKNMQLTARLFERCIEISANFRKAYNNFRHKMPVIDLVLAIICETKLITR